MICQMLSLSHGFGKSGAAMAAPFLSLCTVNSFMEETYNVVVCGGHGVQWMAWSVHVLAVWWCVVDMGSNGLCGQCTCWQCGGVWWT